ncbi:hypothetical protein M9H77_05097 [Catharanthus roseus]|uniref:Uncharacterized protein n=1 Tax=Catharanthus roseus TaxID=4058 RepID=A0ACC0CFX9_CATRO|nr:hypothetical protein M9H77_05097 [Catharanthus roseus]
MISYDPCRWFFAEGSAHGPFFLKLLLQKYFIKKNKKNLSGNGAQENLKRTEKVRNYSDAQEIWRRVVDPYRPQAIAGRQSPDGSTRSGQSATSLTSSTSTKNQEPPVPLRSHKTPGAAKSGEYTQIKCDSQLLIGQNYGLSLKNTLDIPYAIPNPRPSVQLILFEHSSTTECAHGHPTTSCSSRDGVVGRHGLHRHEISVNHRAACHLNKLNGGYHTHLF